MTEVEKFWKQRGDILTEDLETLRYLLEWQEQTTTAKVIEFMLKVSAEKVSEFERKIEEKSV